MERTWEAYVEMGMMQPQAKECLMSPRAARTPTLPYGPWELGVTALSWFQASVLHSCDRRTMFVVASW